MPPDAVLKSLSQETLHRLLRYEPETGHLYWKPRELADFSITKARGAGNLVTWNKRFAGKPAFTASDRGYYHGMIFGIAVRAAHVVWAMHFGAKHGHLDHIDGNPGNNRLSNLRVVTACENSRNQSMRSNNTSGHPGVYWEKNRNKWRVSISNHYHGYFQHKEDAIVAAKGAYKSEGYTARHGGF